MGPSSLAKNRPPRRYLDRRRVPDKLPVYTPFGGVAYSATVAEIRRMIRAGCAEAITYRKNKQRLYGARLLEGPSRPHAGTRYVHCREVSETWTDRDGIVHVRPRLEPNCRGVYTLKPISHLDRALFMRVQTDCLRPFDDSRHPVPGAVPKAS